jgi:hypothetical protein
MELLPGFRMRPPQDEDADEVAAFANEECIAFLGVPVVDADWLGSLDGPGGSIATMTSPSSSRPTARSALS